MKYKNTIDGELLSQMLVGGFNNLSHNKEYLDEINVFPVSDNDTGTNMKNTYSAGIATLHANGSFYETFGAFVRGMLGGARGNSGFIFSQYFLGIYEHLIENDTVSVIDLSLAMKSAYLVTYRAVSNPMEGTMLTIMREGIEKTLHRIDGKTSVHTFFDILVSEMFFCTQETVKQMDLLRDNTVLDSGALGLFLIFDGMKRALLGEEQHFDCANSDILPRRSKELIKNILFFRYCTQFILKICEGKSKDVYLHMLKKRGDSIVVTINENTLNAHIHTNLPQKVLEEFSRFGNIISTKVDDLFHTQEFAGLKQRKHANYAIFAFVQGEGNAKTLEQLGADVAFCVPSSYNICEEELKVLLEQFLKEDLIVFPSDKETYKLLKNIQWYGNYPNLYVAESEHLTKTFFLLSSLIFNDEFKIVTKSLENLKKRQAVQARIRKVVIENDLQFECTVQNKSIVEYGFAELLERVEREKLFSAYSTIIVFAGKKPRQEDVVGIHEQFFGNDEVDFFYFDGQQTDCDFIVGAF